MLNAISIDRTSRLSAVIFRWAGLVRLLGFPLWVLTPLFRLAV